MDLNISNKIDIDQLLLSKNLSPLNFEQIEKLKHIQNYAGVENFNEAEVRSYIIDPILRLLGYDKGTKFSSNLENHLSFLGKKRRSDYHVTLWEENFWLIEAKRPRPSENNFSYEHFEQALQYSVHPDVNASLVVLCDGLKIEVFDREVSVDAPILHVDVKNLVEDFDKLRALLEPMQNWFFQKRRIVRLVDKVFDKEFVMNRVEEFSDIITRRLRSKSQRIIENFRNIAKSDEDAPQRAVKSASLIELTELFMPYDYSVQVDHMVNIRLIELSAPSTFPVMSRLFPDTPRASNESFVAQAGIYLLALSKVRDSVEFAPAWLSPARQSRASLEPMIKFYLDQCLTYFAESEPHRLVLLAANAILRIGKIFAISNPEFRNIGKDLHAIARFYTPELSWEQIHASPEKQILGLIDSQTSAALDNFVTRNTDSNRRFMLESARIQLRNYWDFEIKLLSALPNYRKLLSERSLGEIRMTESLSVTYDNLAHSLLCRLDARFPEWRDYLQTERRPQLEKIAAMGSWAARNILDIRAEDQIDLPPDEELAARFFLGDVNTLRAIRTAYNDEDGTASHAPSSVIPIS